MRQISCFGVVSVTLVVRDRLEMADYVLRSGKKPVALIRAASED